jgi:hypothetical protein
VKRWFAVLAAGAVLQLAIPAQAASPIMVALCSGGAPIRLPIKNHSSDQQSCKICHSAMRKRGGADSGGFENGGEEEE